MKNKEIHEAWCDEFKQFFIERGDEFNNDLQLATIKFLVNKLISVEARLQNLEQKQNKP